MGTQRGIYLQNLKEIPNDILNTNVCIVPEYF